MALLLVRDILVDTINQFILVLFLMYSNALSGVIVGVGIREQERSKEDQRQSKLFDGNPEHHSQS